MPQPLSLCSRQGTIIRPIMSCGPERSFVVFSAHPVSELWEVPRGDQNPTGWNEWRVWPVGAYGGIRGRSLGEPWTYWWRDLWPQTQDAGQPEGRGQRMVREDFPICLYYVTFACCFAGIWHKTGMYGCER